ncbi:hypothetical protein ACWEPZ_03805 [Streptomyces sp. NPDC004288]
MPENTPARRVCRDCDGFPVVHIATGLPTVDGTRDTVRVNCPTCKGTGHTTPAALVRAGK